MITFRREYLDSFLFENVSAMQGEVLDVGGRRKQKRGLFRPPVEKVTSWKYLNPDPASEPDLVATAEALPLPASSADTVVMTEVLEYVSDPLQALREVHRVLRPGGTALVSVPLLSPIHGDWQFDRFRFTRSGLEQLVKSSGFSGADISEMGGLGAVCFDLLEAATGYAHPDPGFSAKIARKLLYLFVPLFRLFDRPSKFVTTGYSMKLKKEGPNA